MGLRASGEDYLEAILVLKNKKGYVRSKDVAEHLDVSRPSVSRAVAYLRDGGFLSIDEDHFLHLTELGHETAKTVYEKHLFFSELLIEAGVDPQTAEAEACQIEHSISAETFQRLKKKKAEAKNKKGL